LKVDDDYKHPEEVTDTLAKMLTRQDSHDINLLSVDRVAVNVEVGEDLVDLHAGGEDSLVAQDLSCRR